MKTEKMLKNYHEHARWLLFILMLLPILSNAANKKWTVKVSDFAFTPYNLTHVKAGDTICWEWTEGSHTTTSVEVPSGAYSWDSFINKEMTEFSYIPEVNGTYTYRSTLNPDHPMNGTFVVTGASTVTSPFLSSAVAYPNPFTDVVVLRSLDNRIYTSAEVFDQSGRPVVSYRPDGSAEEQYLRMPAALPPGIYIFRFTTGTGDVTTIRLIKSERHL
jgi:plastocyanin